MFITTKKCINENAMINDFKNVPWQICSIFDDVDDSLWCWEQLYNSTISSHTNIRRVKIRRNSQPWMNGTIRKQINKRYKLLIQARKTKKGSIEWKQFKKQRNYCTTLVRTAKSNHWKDKFDSADSIKSFWKTVNEFKGTIKKKKIGHLKAYNKVITSDKEKKKIFLTAISPLSQNN